MASLPARASLIGENPQFYQCNRQPQSRPGAPPPGCSGPTTVQWRTSDGRFRVPGAGHRPKETFIYSGRLRSMTASWQYHFECAFGYLRPAAEIHELTMGQQQYSGSLPFGLLTPAKITSGSVRPHHFARSTGTYVVEQCRSRIPPRVKPSGAQINLLSFHDDYMVGYEVAGKEREIKIHVVSSARLSSSPEAAYCTVLRFEDSLGDVHKGRPMIPAVQHSRHRLPTLPQPLRSPCQQPADDRDHPKVHRPSQTGCGTRVIRRSTLRTALCSSAMA